MNEDRMGYPEGELAALSLMDGGEPASDPERRSWAGQRDWLARNGAVVADEEPDAGGYPASSREAG